MQLRNTDCQISTSFQHVQAGESDKSIRFIIIIIIIIIIIVIIVVVKYAAY